MAIFDIESAIRRQHLSRKRKPFRRSTPRPQVLEQRLERSKVVHHRVDGARTTLLRDGQIIDVIDRHATTLHQNHPFASNAR